MLAREFAINLTYFLIIYSLVIFGKVFQPMRLIDILGNDIENLDLIISRHFVTGCRLLNLQSNISVGILHIFSEPDGTKLAPA